MLRAATALAPARAAAATAAWVGSVRSALPATAIGAGAVRSISSLQAPTRCWVHAVQSFAAVSVRRLHCRPIIYNDATTSPSVSSPSTATGVASPASSSSSSAALPPSDPPLPFAVVGSGPAAFYTCKYLLRELPNCRIDMFERLPVPYGLVRFGVAPDHPDVKAVSHEFEAVINDARFAFWGNVRVVGEGYEGEGAGEEGATPGTGAAAAATGDLSDAAASSSPPVSSVSIVDLRRHYAGVVLAYGASSERTLHIPGSQLQGIHPSRHLVNWYNAHPELEQDRDDAESQRTQFDLANVKDVVIIGQGNVAIDCARVLLSPLSRLEHTDISDAALEALSQADVAAVHMVGRRGAAQSAFSIGELREMATGVEGIRVRLQEDEMRASENEASLKEIEARPKKRKHDLMRQILAGTVAPATATAVATAATAPPTKDLHIRYLLNPKEFLPHEDDPSRVGAVVFERTALRGVAEQQEAVGTGELVTLPAQLVLTSIGYRSLPLAGVPFDSRKHVIPSVHGRVTNNEGVVQSGLYVSGWLRRGPSGIIATNITDARDTVKSVMQDVQEGRLAQPEIGAPLPLLSGAAVSSGRVVSRDGWARIDAAERARGLEQGRPRVKIAARREMIQIARGGGDQATDKIVP